MKSKSSFIIILFSVFIFLFLGFFAGFKSNVSAQDTGDLSTPQEIAQRVREAREEAMEKRQEAKEELQSRREEAQEDMEQKRKQLRERLRELRGEQKAGLAERLSGNINRINQKWVTHWLTVLDRLSQVLAKMQVRADRLDELDHDTTQARERIETAYGEITFAQEALSRQAEKVYGVEFGESESIGEGIKASIILLRQDLSDTKAFVRDAILATKDALSSLKAVSQESNDEIEEEGESEKEETQEADLVE